MRVCVPNGVGSCVRPFHDARDRSGGGAHGPLAGMQDVDGGKMDGFIRVSFGGLIRRCRRTPKAKSCAILRHPGAHGLLRRRASSRTTGGTRKSFVLSDRMFEPNWGWSLPAHLWLVSGWSARCTMPTDPSTCTSNLDGPTNGPSSTLTRYPHGPLYGWTDLTYLLHAHHIPWAYYVERGAAPDCDDRADQLLHATEGHEHAGDVEPAPELRHGARQQADSGTCSRSRSSTARRSAGRCRRSRGSRPNYATSEHPGASVAAGQAWVTRLVNAVMRGPDWKSVGDLPHLGRLGRLLRPRSSRRRSTRTATGCACRRCVISPYARRGFIDHQTLSFDAYLKFIEDDFLGGARIDPKTDGRPDPRPTVREDVPVLGDLAREFDFAQAPRPPLLLKLGR